MQPKFNMTQRENIFLAKRNIVDYIWKSANLEGIGVTYPDTQTIYDGIAVSGYTIDEINAINDLKHAWQYVLENINLELDLDFIKHTHMLLGKFTVINAGFLRRDEVRYRRYKPDSRFARRKKYTRQNKCRYGKKWYIRN